MPRRKRFPVAAPQAIRRASVPRAPQMVSSGVPALDAALGGGLPLGRLTEIIGGTAYGSPLLVANFIATRQRGAPHTNVVWTDLGGTLDLGLLDRAGVDLDRVTVLTPRDGADALNHVFAQLVSHPSHILVISGLPNLSRRDMLFIGLLERLALLIPGTRTVLVCLSAPETTGAALARFAAVRLTLDNETIITDRTRTIYAADLTVLKNRFAAAGRKVALRLTAKPPRAAG